MENAIECYHCSRLHRGYHDCAPSHNQLREPLPGHDSAIVFQVATTHKDAAFTPPTYQALFPVLPDLTDDERHQMTWVAVPPNVIISLQCDNVHYYLWTPAGPERVNVVVGGSTRLHRGHVDLRCHLPASSRTSPTDHRAGFLRNQGCAEGAALEARRTGSVRLGGGACRALQPVAGRTLPEGPELTARAPRALALPLSLPRAPPRGPAVASAGRLGAPLPLERLAEGRSGERVRATARRSESIADRGRLRHHTEHVGPRGVSFRSQSPDPDERPQPVLRTPGWVKRKGHPPNTWID